MKRELEDHFETDAKKFNDTIEISKLLFKERNGDKYERLGNSVKNRLHDYLKE